MMANSIKRPNLPALEAIKKVHIVGVCGTLMGAFAAYLQRHGIEVTGSDQNVYPPMSDVLRNAGVKLLNGYSVENIKKSQDKPDLVVIGNVIRTDNVEARAVIDGGLPYSSLPEAMERLFLEKTRNLVVSGTHGKTTTSSMLAHVLNYCKRDPSYFIGGVSLDLPFSFHISKLNNSTPFVLEGDEYDTAFWDKVPKFNHYLPNDVILTSVEYDHADIYADLNAVMKAFEGLISRIRKDGRLIACYDYSTVRTLAKVAQVPVITYGNASSIESGVRYSPGRVSIVDGKTQFEILENGKQIDEVLIQLPGKHNVMNALAVWIECRELGIPMAEVRSALESFRGVKRRQEVRAEIKGVTVIDDFAHHPTAVRETLNALRLKYPKHRILAVFEPRSATSRRKIFQKDYAMAFQDADQVFIAKPYDQTKISADNVFSSEMLIDDLRKSGKTADLISQVDEGVCQVAAVSRKGDLIAVLSNGGFEGFIPKLIGKLEAI